MKRLIYITFCLFTGLCFGSCNSDFLEENKKTLIGSLEEPILIYDSNDLNKTVELEYPSLQNKKYTIWQYPQWMKFDALKGEFKDGHAELKFRMNIVTDHIGNRLDGVIVLDVENLGCVEIYVLYYTLGSPIVNISPSSLQFGREQEEAFFDIRNIGVGDLSWSIISCPEWIVPSVSTCKDCMIPQGGAIRVNVGCARDNLASGVYTGEIVIENNFYGLNIPGKAKISKIPVSMEVLTLVNPENVWLIDGIVTGARFDKKRDLLFVTAKSPNELIIFDTKQPTPSGMTVSKVSLGSAPRCLSLSEDGDYLFVGLERQLLQYDVSSMALVKSIELNFIPFDVVYGENDWCYLSLVAEYNYKSIYCVNIKTGEIRIPEFSYFPGSFYTEAYFTKVPGEAKILLTCSSILPPGVFLFDISEPGSNEQATVQYWHKDYSLGRPFWLSKNGDLVYTGDGSVLRNPAKGVPGDDLIPVDKLPYNEIRWIDRCDATQSLWGATRPDVLDYSKVFRLNSSGYSQINSMMPSDHVATINHVKDLYPTAAHYVFSNSAGTMLFMVKNINNSPYWFNYVNAWSVECLEIK